MRIIYLIKTALTDGFLIFRVIYQLIKAEYSKQIGNMISSDGQHRQAANTALMQQIALNTQAQQMGVEQHGWAFKDAAQQWVQKQEKRDPFHDRYVSLAMQQLRQVVQTWIKQNYICKYDPIYGPHILDHDLIKTKTFADDMQILCIVPQLFTRQHHFFKLLMLKFRNKADITEIYPMPKAHSPTIKLKLYGLQFKIAMAIIPRALVSPDIHIVYNIHKYLSHKTQLWCLVSYRTHFYLQKSITHYSSYRIALKVLVNWCHRNHIYSSEFGYLCGTSLSIMLAKVYQQCPTRSALALVLSFFEFYTKWDWKQPVCINPSSHLQDTQSVSQIVILTPIEPYFNIAEHIPHYSAQLIKQLISKAHHKLSTNNSIDQLLTYTNFFNKYQHFLCLVVSSSKLQIMQQSIGLFQSKLIQFINIFQINKTLQKFKIYILPQRFQSVHLRYDYCIKYFIGIKYDKNYNRNNKFEIIGVIKDFAGLIQDCLEPFNNCKKIYYQFDKFQRSDIENTIINQAQYIFQ